MMKDLNFFIWTFHSVFMLLLFIMMLYSNLYKFNPLIMGFFLIIYVLLICLQMNFLSSSFWYSYILFLVMVGGLMILFLYFLSLCMNELYYIDKTYIFYMSLKMFLLSIILYIYLNLYDEVLNLLMNESSEIFTLKEVELNSSNFYYKNLMSMVNLDLTFIMMFYLLLTMICVVLICMKLYIPLRKLSN